MEIIKEKKCIITTDKKNEMELFLRNYSDEELSITLINKYPLKKYELKCNLEEFQKNRFFKIFINVNEIMKELENKIEKSTFIEDSNCIVIEIEIGLTIINEILLVIEEKEKNKDEIIEILEKNIKELNKKLDEKDNLLKNAEEKIKLLEEKERQKIKIESKILQKNEEQLILNYLNKTENVTFELLYRATEDGDKASIYHNKCDNTGPNLTLVETKNGYRFGGYSSVNLQSYSINGNGVHVEDKNAFVFSLNKKRKYIPKNTLGALHMNKDYGPIFGKDYPNYAFLVDNGFLTGNTNNWCFKCENYGIEENELAGITNISVKEVEVFKINYK